METAAQNFTTVLSNGDLVALCENGHDKLVEKGNIEDFIDLVLKARSSEACQ